MKTVLLVAAFGLCSLTSLYAQRSQPQEIYKILGISVEGNTFADPAAVIANSGLRVGGEVAVGGDQIGQAVRRLWSLKIFNDIQIAIDRKVADGAYLVIKVQELPRYDGIVIEGADEIGEDDILKKVNLVKGQVFAPQELVRIKKDVQIEYSRFGKERGPTG